MNGRIIESIPAFKVSVASYRGEIYERFDDIIDSGMLLMGKYTKLMEEAFATDHQRKFAFGVMSDTAALECAIQYIIRPGDVVLMPQTGHFADVNVVLRLGGKVVLVDVTVSNGAMPTLDQWMEGVDYCQRKFNTDPRLVMLIYSAGQPSHNTVEVCKYFRSLGIWTLEDCAHNHGSKYPDGRLVGSEADVATWSLYATKIIHCGEGGVIVTNDENMATYLQEYRSYGKKAQTADGVFTEQLWDKGYNWRLTEWQSAVGLTMWEHKDEIIEARKKIAQLYDHVFPPRSEPEEGDESAYSLSPTEGDAERNYYRYSVMVPGLRAENNHLIYNYLRACRPRITLQEKCNHLPLSMMGAYSCNPNVFPVSWHFPEAMKYCAEHLCLPIYPQLSPTDAVFIRTKAKEAIKFARDKAQIW